MNSLRRAKPQTGFTLLELVTVISIIAVLAYTSVSNMPQDDSPTRTVAEQLRSSLRYAQRIAMTRNRSVCVTVAIRSITFRQAQSAGAAIPCGTTALTAYNDSNSSLDILLAAGSATTFTGNGNFRFTPTGALVNNAGNALTLRTIAVNQNGTTFSTMNIQADNGYVLATTF